MFFFFSAFDGQEDLDVAQQFTSVEADLRRYLRVCRDLFGRERDEFGSIVVAPSELDVVSVGTCDQTVINE